MGANGSVYIADVLRENLYILDLVSQTYGEKGEWSISIRVYLQHNFFIGHDIEYPTMQLF